MSGTLVALGSVLTWPQVVHLRQTCSELVTMAWHAKHSCVVHIGRNGIGMTSMLVDEGA